MNYTHIFILFLMAGLCVSCGGQAGPDSPKDNRKSETPDIVPSTRSKDPAMHTQYVYRDVAGKRLVIQNSFPKAGPGYKDPTGKEYVYAVFWTRIINETVDTLKAAIDFPPDSFSFPASSGNYMKLLLPSDTATREKEPLFDYGLNVRSFLDHHRYTSSALKRVIPPGGWSAFYVVILSNEGVNGVLRPGLSLRGQDLFYTISSYTPSPHRPPTLSLANEKRLRCGSINLKNLRLQK